MGYFCVFMCVFKQDNSCKPHGKRWFSGIFGIVTPFFRYIHTFAPKNTTFHFSLCGLSLASTPAKAGQDM